MPLFPLYNLSGGLCKKKKKNQLFASAIKNLTQLFILIQANTV